MRCKISLLAVQSFKTFKLFFFQISSGFLRVDFRATSNQLLFHGAGHRYNHGLEFKTKEKKQIEKKEELICKATTKWKKRIENNSRIRPHRKWVSDY